MKVLIIECSDFENFPIGGQLSFLKTIIPFLNIEPYLVGISLYNKNNVGKWVKKNFNGKDIPFFSVGTIYPQKKFKNKIIPYRFRFIFWLYFYRKKILSKNVEIIYTRLYEAALPFVYQNFPPVILHMAGANNPLEGSRFSWARCRIMKKFYEKVIIKIVIKNVKKIIGINNECKRIAYKFGNTKFIKIPIGIDYSLFYPHDKINSRMKLNLPLENIIIVYIGRLAKIKGLDLLLDGFKIFLNWIPSAILLIAGDGEDKQRIQKRIESIGIKEKIYMLGAIKHELIPFVLSAADIFVLTSFAEGTPNALLEAMACGLPVVATNVGGIGEVVKDGVNGYLIRSRNPLILALAMKKAFMERTVLGQGAIDTIKKGYLIQDIAHKIEEIFIDVCRS